MSHNMVHFGALAAEIDPVVWGTPANFNGFRVLAALLHGILVTGVPQTPEAISASSKPTFTIFWGHVEEILLLNKFFSDCRYMSQL